MEKNGFRYTMWKWISIYIVEMDTHYGKWISIHNVEKRISIHNVENGFDTYCGNGYTMLKNGFRYTMLKTISIQLWKWIHNVEKGFRIIRENGFRYHIVKMDTHYGNGYNNVEKRISIHTMEYTQC